MILCTKCNSFKAISDYYIYNNKIKRPCKLCKLNYQKNNYSKNIFNIKQYKQSYYANNKSVILANQSLNDSKRKLFIKEYQKLYRQINKFNLNKNKRLYIKNVLNKSINYRLRRRLSNAIYYSIRSNKMGASIIKYLPYSIKELRNHLESQFESWMTWSNWGSYNKLTWNDSDMFTWVWNIDHIISQANLPYNSMDDNNFKKCWSLENLRPYSAKQNIIDGIRK